MYINIGAQNSKQKYAENTSKKLYTEKLNTVYIAEEIQLNRFAKPFSAEYSLVRENRKKSVESYDTTLLFRCIYIE